ncbi:hypothetical protein SGODD07_01518 [Streptococcus gordonii]|uniref:Uncharacterized protein n=1 Tax=Streptococcus gordonii TaxID=1302 RepID=A0A139N3B1_STRGN|nr:hypothetical protein SGODD07_01518 [Streptococcus gordonii]
MALFFKNHCGANIPDIGKDEQLLAPMQFLKFLSQFSLLS